MDYDVKGVQFADDGLEKRRKKSSDIKKKAIKFTKIVSLVGLRHATDARNSNPRRFVWVAWVVFGVGLAVYQIQEQVETYLQYPSSTNMRVTSTKVLRFPQVTVCSDNQILASKARGTAGKGHFIAIANVENTMQRLRVYEERGYEEHLTKQTRILLREYIETLHNITIDWYNISKELAPPAETSIPIVSFDEERNNRSLIEEVITDLGHCFAFGTNNMPLYTRKPGPLNGLNLILKAPRTEIIPNVRYLANSDSFPGFRVLIHDPDDIPRMRHAGFSLKPGRMTRVTVELKNVTLQGKPYGTCDDKNMTYKASHCLASCDDDEFVARCGCKNIYMDKNASICSYGQIINCSHALLRPSPEEENVIDADASCICPKQCHRRVYKTSVTTSTFPQVMSDEVKAAQGKEGPQGSVEDLMQVIIYYPQLSYFEVESVPGYTPFKFLCDVGNALSLLLGATLLTIYEASEFLIVFISDYLRFRFAK